MNEEIKKDDLLENKAKRLREHFSTLVAKCKDHFVLSDLQLLLTVQLTNTNGRTPDVQKVCDEADAIESCDKFLKYLIRKGLLGYLNYTLLRTFIQLIKIPEMLQKLNKEIQEYEQEFERFCTEESFINIIEHLKEEFPLNEIVGLPELELKIRQSSQQGILHSVLNSLKQFKWFEYALLWKSAQEGCVEMVYNVLPKYHLEIATDLKSKAAMLKKQGIEVKITPFTGNDKGIGGWI